MTTFTVTSLNNIVENTRSKFSTYFDNFQLQYNDILSANSITFTNKYDTIIRQSTPHFIFKVPISVDVSVKPDHSINQPTLSSTQYADYVFLPLSASHDYAFVYLKAGHFKTSHSLIYSLLQPLSPFCKTYLIPHSHTPEEFLTSSGNSDHWHIRIIPNAYIEGYVTTNLVKVIDLPISRTKIRIMFDVKSVTSSYSTFTSIINTIYKNLTQSDLSNIEEYFPINNEIYSGCNENYDANFLQPSFIKVFCEEVSSRFSSSKHSKLLSIIPLTGENYLTTFNFLNPVDKTIRFPSSSLTLEFLDPYNRKVYFSSDYPTVVKMSTRKSKRDFISLTVCSDDKLSQNHFPSNSPQNFNFILPSEINLEGEWEVNVKSLIIPSNIPNLFPPVNSFQIVFENEENTIYFPAKQYTLQSIFETFKELLIPYGISVKLEKNSFVLLSQWAYTIIFNPELAFFLGFSNDLQESKIKIEVDNKKRLVFPVEPNLDTFFPHIINIFTDFTSPVIFNNRRDPIIKSVGLTGAKIYGKKKDVTHQYYYIECYKDEAVKIPFSTLRMMNFRFHSAISNLPVQFDKSTIPCIINLEMYRVG